MMEALHRWQKWMLMACSGILCLECALLCMHQQAQHAPPHQQSTPHSPSQHAVVTLHQSRFLTSSSSKQQRQQRHILLNVGLPRTGGQQALSSYAACQGWHMVMEQCGADYPTCAHCLAQQWQSSSSWLECLSAVTPTSDDYQPVYMALTRLDVETSKPYSWFLPQHGALEALAFAGNELNDNLDARHLDASSSTVLWALTLRSNATVWAESILHWHSVTQRLWHALNITSDHDSSDKATLELPHPVTHDQLLQALNASIKRAHDWTLWNRRRQQLVQAYEAHAQRVRATAAKYGVPLVEMVVDENDTTNNFNKWTSMLHQHGWPTGRPHCWKGTAVAQQLDNDWRDFSTTSSYLP